MKAVYLNNLKIHTNTNLEDTDGIFLEKEIEGLETPKLRVSSYELEGENGGYVSNQLYSARLITLTGSIYNRNVTEFEENRRKLIINTRIKKDQDGLLLPHLLLFTTNDDINLQTEVYLRDIKMNKTNYGCVADFQLDLIAPDFRLYSQTKTEIIQDVKATGGAVVATGIDFLLPRVLSTSKNESYIITNNGNINTYPIITITGECNNPQIINTTTGAFLEISTDLKNGEKITIDTYQKKVIKNVDQNILSDTNLSLYFPFLAEGGNIFSFYVESGFSEVKFEYRDAYLGV